MRTAFKSIAIAMGFAVNFASAAPPERVALLIGNSSYEHGNPLKNPEADAVDMAEALGKCGFSLVGGKAMTDLGHEEMSKLLVDFRRMSAEAKVALFFYAGHGLEVDGANYLVPVDAEVQEKYQVKHRTVSVDEVLAAMANGSEKLKIVILDSCRNNPLGRGWGRSGGGGFSTPGYTPDGTILLFSAAPGKVAADGSGRNSPFTHVLKEEILRKGISVEQVFKRVGAEVWRGSGQQRPWMNSSYYSEFVFLPGKPSPLPVPEVEENSGADHWRDVDMRVDEIWEMEARGKTGEALVQVGELIKQEARYAKVYALWIYLLEEVGQSVVKAEEASGNARKSALARAIIEPEDPTALFLATCWQNDREWSEDYNQIDVEVEARIRKAIGLSPLVAQYHTEHGSVLLSLGRIDEAVRAYRESIRLQPTLLSQRVNLIFALTDLNEETGEYSWNDEARGEARNLVGMSGNKFDPLLQLFDSFEGSANNAFLKELTTLFLKNNPGDEAALALLARLD